MTPERYQQIKEIFNATMEQNPSARGAFLSKCCNGDLLLKESVENLLAAHEKSAGFIEKPAFSLAADFIHAEPSSATDEQRIGPYKIIDELGHGGMGVVYLAERDDDVFKNRVAIKLVRRGLDNEDIVGRFINERQILANLNHPNIARLLDGGTTQNGLPYLIMEFVEGLPITEYCDEHKLSTEARLNLFRDVCAAVHYAHQNLVIHRDLKPGNILVTKDGVPKLLDFGIAKVFNAEVAQTEATMTVARVMTPDYASPEQVRGKAITTASDIYTLGVLLYQLLTGHRPYRLKTRLPDELSRIICEEEPEKPSTAVIRIDEAKENGRTFTLTPDVVSQNRSEVPAKLRRRLKGDLDNIVMMAMRKEPHRRYASVEQFAEDLRRHTNGLPVLARQDTVNYRFSKFVKRNRLAVAAASVIVLSLIAGIITTAWQAKRANEQARLADEQSALAREQRDKAEIEQAKAQRINQFFQQMLSYANPAWYAPGSTKRRDITVLETLDEAAKQIDTELNDQPEIKAEIYKTLGDTFSNLSRYAQAMHCYEMSLKIRRDLFGDNHYRTIESLYHVGSLSALMGDFDTAEKLYTESIAFHRQEVKDAADSRLLPFILLDMGSLLINRGEITATRPIFSETVEIFRKQNGAEHITVGIAQKYLGDTYRYLGDNEKALVEYQQSRRILERSKESNYTSVLLQIAKIQAGTGKFKEAEDLMKEALQISQNLYGEKGTTHSLTSLAHLAFLKGENAKAKSYVEKAMAIADKAKGHPDTVGYLSFLGRIAMRMGQVTKGEAYLQEALKIQTGIAKKELSLAGIKMSLGECLLLQKRYAEAEPLLLSSYDAIKSNHVMHSPSLKEALQLLVKLYDAWGKREATAIHREQLNQLPSKEG
jgi:serine/threonine protein kinase/Tfp pilus assembly protein PilF